MEPRWYAPAMRDDPPNIQRTTVEIDMDALELARHDLGTTTTKDTVRAALMFVHQQVRLKRAADLIRSGAMNIVQPEDLAELRRVEP